MTARLLSIISVLVLTMMTVAPAHLAPAQGLKDGNWQSNGKRRGIASRIERQLDDIARKKSGKSAATRETAQPAKQKGEGAPRAFFAATLDRRAVLSALAASDLDAATKKSLAGHLKEAGNAAAVRDALKDIREALF